MTYRVKSDARVLIVRTAMIGGGGLAYDVYVPLADIQNGDEILHRVIRGDRELVPFCAATVPPHVQALSVGLERYDAYTAHTKEAGRHALKMARDAFPELHGWHKETLPLLWIHGLMDEETSAERWLPLIPAPAA